MPRQSELPGLWRSLKRSLLLGYHAEPRLFVLSFALIALAPIPASLTPLWLKLLVEGVVTGGSEQIGIACAGVGVSVALLWLLSTLGGRLGQQFRMRAQAHLGAEVARLQASVVGIEHFERPDLLDRLHPLRDQAFLLDHLYSSFMQVVGLAILLLVTVGLLASVHPAMVLLALFAVPAAMASSWRAGAERRALDLSAPHDRLSRHLFQIGISPGFAKDLRITRAAELLVSRRRQAWEAGRRPITAVRWGNAWFSVATWSLFSLAYAGAAVLTVVVLHRPPAGVVLLLAAGSSLARYLGQVIGTAQFLRWTIDATSRLAWLEDYVALHRDRGDLPAPERLRQGLRLENVSFAYPGTDRLVLEDVHVDLPAGAVVAVVGENGAGKTTLVKLLCRMYEPTAGRITVDGEDLARIPAEQWRTRISGAFQDFMRFEYQARSTVGVGDHEKLDDPLAVGAAVERGGAAGVVERLPQGLETQLGASWEGGTDLSFGQWQKLALARGFMPDRPLLLVLDEPTAALDAETEHALFERFAAESRAAAEDGRITVLVSHRFSTVRMADKIVVLDGAHVREQGSHEELMARGGLYAELYGIQARAYR